MKRIGGIWIVIGGVVGYAVALVQPWLADRRLEERLKAQRVQELDDRRVAFQRDTLLELQDAALDVARTSAQIHVADLKPYRSAGGKTPFGSTQLDPELDEAASVALRRQGLLRQRVHNDEIRDLVLVFTERANDVTGAKSEKASEDGMEAMSPAFESVMGLSPQI